MTRRLAPPFTVYYYDRNHQPKSKRFDLLAQEAYTRAVYFAKKMFQETGYPVEIRDKFFDHVATFEQ